MITMEEVPLVYYLQSLTVYCLPLLHTEEFQDYIIVLIENPPSAGYPSTKPREQMVGEGME